jgi:hypothetical protein
MAIPLSWLMIPTAAVAGDVFTFGGLGLSTTVADVRRQYPRSTINDGHIRVAESDARNDIRAIDLPGTGVNRRLRIMFEREGRRGAEYPACDQVLAPIRLAYGAPSTTQEFDEERARNRRYIWSRGGETLSLLCFRLNGTEFLASDLTIAPLQD